MRLPTPASLPRSSLRDSRILVLLLLAWSLSLWAVADVFVGMRKDLGQQIPVILKVVHWTQQIQVIVVGFLVNPFLIWKDYGWDADQAK